MGPPAALTREGPSGRAEQESASPGERVSDRSCITVVALLETLVVQETDTGRCERW